MAVGTYWNLICLLRPSPSAVIADVIHIGSRRAALIGGMLAGVPVALGAAALLALNLRGRPTAEEIVWAFLAFSPLLLAPVLIFGGCLAHYISGIKGTWLSQLKHCVMFACGIRIAALSIVPTILAVCAVNDLRPLAFAVTPSAAVAIAIGFLIVAVWDFRRCNSAIEQRLIALHICVHCGYDIIDDENPVCPECGWRTGRAYLDTAGPAAAGVITS